MLIIKNLTLECNKYELSIAKAQVSHCERVCIAAFRTKQ